MMMTREELLKLEKEAAIDILLAIIAELTETVKRQAEKIAELEARVNQNSQNSSKPPSSDGYKKPNPVSLRQPSGKKPGGQKGHKGNGLKLTHAPNRCESYAPERCVDCPRLESCASQAKVSETRYEIDIKIETDVTAHQALRIHCPQTDETLTGEFPEHINGTVQYGINLKALAVALNTVGAVSLNRTHEILGGVFGIPISTGAIAQMASDCAKKAAKPIAEIREALSKEPLTHADETGVRVDEKTIWAHVVSTKELTKITVHEKRGKIGMDAGGVLPNCTGTTIHDCFSPYFKYENIRHGLCNAHLLRELTAVTENTGQPWAKEMSDLLLEMKRWKEVQMDKGLTNPSANSQKRFFFQYDLILASALLENPIPPQDETKRGRPKRGKVRALIDRLVDYKDMYLLFYTDFAVPFDNNQAERDIRMFKVKQKVSGCFRTISGAKDFASILSFVSTARKHGRNAFSAIKSLFTGEVDAVVVASE